MTVFKVYKRDDKSILFTTNDKFLTYLEVDTDWIDEVYHFRLGSGCSASDQFWFFKYYFYLIVGFHKFYSKELLE